MTNGNPGITLSSSETLNRTASLFANTSGDPSLWNYALPAGSPAINFGTDVGYKTDFIGNAITSNPDAGILEFVNVATNLLPKPDNGKSTVLSK